MTGVEWTFPSAPKCEIKGLNDSGVETFRGDTIVSLAREICQNSLDARVKVEDGTDPGPVEVEFALFELPATDFPAFDEFKDAMTRSAEFWKDNAQATEFFSAMRPSLEARTISCLRISDANTIGLTGVQVTNLEEPSNWRSLVMSSGVSDKPGNSGGSFGIGKYAAFSCSQFRTVFYSTKTADGKEGFQGVSRLVTFKTDDDEMALGTGYLGAADALPLMSWTSLDPLYTRTRPGTDIYIPAFVGGENFKSDIVSSVLDGFLYAIWMKRLVVKIDTGDELTTMDKSWLMKAYRDRDPLFESVRNQYEALKVADDKWAVKDFGARGRIRLSLLNGKDFDKRVAMIRQPGMLIFKKDRFRSHISFTGVLIVEGDLNAELRRFENPQHNRWEEKRDPANTALLDEIYGFCREEIGKIVRDNLGEEIDSGLGDVLPDSGEDGDPRTEEVLDVKAKNADVKVSEPVRHKKRRGKAVTGGTPTGKVHGSDTHDGKRPKKIVTDTGEGGERTVRRREVGHSSFRSICRDKVTGSYLLKIVPEKDCAQAAVDVIAVAEIKDYVAPVRAARLEDGTELKVRNGEVSGMGFRKGVPLKIELSLDYSDYVSLEVECYEYK